MTTPDYPSPELDRVLQAADRILHMGYPDELTKHELVRRYTEDAALCASWLLSMSPQGLTG